METNFVAQEEMKSSILNSIGEAVIIVEPHGRIIRNCNSVTEELFGYNKSELIGQETSILHVSRKHYDQFGKESEVVLKRGDVYKGEFQLKRKDGEIIDTYHTVSSLHKEYGWQKGVVSVIRDITDQKKTEKKLKNSINEKSILLSEMHHRVKNNLAIIAGLLYMQIEASVDERVIESLKTSYCRLQSIAQVHEQLYKNAELDANIPLDSYLHQMAESVDQTILLQDKEITIDINSRNITIPLLHAVPLGLLLSELLVNAYKHAFIGRKKGHIEITSRVKEDQLFIEITDDGVGLPKEFSLDIESVGMNIVRTLIKQLKGDISYSSNPEKGTTFTVLFTIDT